MDNMSDYWRYETPEGYVLITRNLGNSLTLEVFQGYLFDRVVNEHIDEEAGQRLRGWLELG